MARERKGHKEVIKVGHKGKDRVEEGDRREVKVQGREKEGNEGGRKKGSEERKFETFRPVVSATFLEGQSPASYRRVP